MVHSILLIRVIWKYQNKQKKRFKLEKVIWAITRQNPLKTKSKSNLKDRIQFAKKFVSKNIFIKVKFYEDKIASNKTIDLIEHSKQK